MNTLRLGLRRLAREPGYVATALLVLALCLGANLVIHAVLYAVLLKPLPYPDADRLFTVYNSYPNAGMARSAASVRNYFTRRNGGVAALESVSAYRYGSEPVGAPGSVVRRPVLRVTPEFFATLGVGLAQGDGFVDADMDVGGAPHVIVSDRYWREQLGGGNVLGRSIDVGGLRRTITGVLPAGFSFLSSNADLYLPLVSSDEQRALNALHGEQAEMLVRLRPGVDAEQALAQLEAHYQQDARGYPWARDVAEAGFAMHVVPLHADHVAAARPAILLLQAGAALLLLIGAANLLNLMLLRHGAAAADAGIRRALGASRIALLQPALVEIALLCTGGTLAAWLLANAALHALPHWASDALPLGARLRMGPESALFALLAGVGLTLALGAVFVALAGRTTEQATIDGGTRTHSDGRRTLAMRRRFAAAQMALAFVLLAGATALALGLEAVRHADPGFDAGHAVVAALALPSTQYPDGDARQRFAARALERMATLPGAVAVGAATNVPVRGRGSFNDRQAIHVLGYQPVPGRTPLLHNRYGVLGDYFDSLGIRLLAGRYLDARDEAPGMRSVVVDEDFARFYWPDGQAVGQRLFNGPDAEPIEQAFTVVGVVASVPQQDVGAQDGNGTLYLPYRYLPHGELFLTMRSGGDAEPLVPALRQRLVELDPRLPLDDVRPMTARIDDTLAAHRGPALLSSVFAAAAVLLAAIGSYGLLSFLVAQGRREIGMRMALGARRGQIVGRYLRLGLRVFAIGGALGIVASALMLQLIATWLPEQPTAGWPALVASLLGLCAITLAACLAPALRAARTSPMVVLAER